jgi:uncharacterized protein (DUF362 family)/Pyruvate/2-oxoacid:ferredoxin oxidoreductase delta subunit
MSKVAVVRCENYDFDKVKEAVEKGLVLLGGAETFVSSGERILLKPNLIGADPPEKASTTHPAVFKAVAEVFKSVGANLYYGDSPGLGVSMEQVARVSGIAAVATEMNIPAADFANGRQVACTEGTYCKKFTIANGILDCEGVISLPKLKTHGLTRFTGAVKNQFGCIPGTLKGEYHVKMQDVRVFSKMLVELNRLVKPRLFIMDGIIGMEGNGPRGGNPRPVKVLLFSSDPVAIDAVACKIICLAPRHVRTLKYGMEGGLGTYLDEEIEILGENIEAIKITDFDTGITEMPAFMKILIGFIGKLGISRPYIKKENCTKCGICIKACPLGPKALSWTEGGNSYPPRYDYKRCIKCFCCQEMCPNKAIWVKKAFLGAIFDLLPRKWIMNKV